MGPQVLSLCPVPQGDPGVHTPPRQPRADPSTCARSCAVSWCELCSCCSISFSTCLCMATCSCRCWFRACDSLRACLVLDDSTSTVLMTYCKGRAEGRATQRRVGALSSPWDPEGTPQEHPTHSPQKKTRGALRSWLSRMLQGPPGIFSFSRAPEEPGCGPRLDTEQTRRAKTRAEYSEASQPCLAHSRHPKPQLLDAYMA